MLEKFDTFYAEAAPKLLAGIYGRESVPITGNDRWPISVVACLPPEVEQIVDGLTSDAIGVAGDGHLRTGAAGSAHVTVRSLERYRAAVPPDDPAVRRYTEAVRSAAAVSPPIDLVFTGVTLTSNGILGQLETVDESLRELMAGLEEALGDDACLERGEPRDLAYVSLLHFADEIRDPVGLIRWVQSHRTMEPVAFTLSDLLLVAYRWTDEREPLTGRRFRQASRTTLSTSQIGTGS
ncbi:MAG: hypothetical protein M3Y35_10470 [Actinomycetota bacterium]|nr:hypothetical protein [Actinomycetota bacterium]